MPIRSPRLIKRVSSARLGQGARMQRARQTTPQDVREGKSFFIWSSTPPRYPRIHVHIHLLRIALLTRGKSRIVPLLRRARQPSHENPLSIRSHFLGKSGGTSAFALAQEAHVSMDDKHGCWGRRHIGYPPSHTLTRSSSSLSRRRGGDFVDEPD